MKSFVVRVISNMIVQAIVLGIFGLLFGWLSTPMYAMAFVANVLFSAWQHKAAGKRYHEGELWIAMCHKQVEGLFESMALSAGLRSDILGLIAGNSMAVVRRWKAGQSPEDAAFDMVQAALGILNEGYDKILTESEEATKLGEEFLKEFNSEQN